VKEMVALGRALEEVSARGNPNGLISAVVGDLKERVTPPGLALMISFGVIVRNVLSQFAP